ncbi:type II toxin-antitoxin system Phd/YefM family antitoxin [Lapidilactobacillus bayanensis]|uniref:type II toxin-antitoxin system Phd/YefM family antitoxin n=1 Tax=Lapidilactobacillus bayanensis TaxID=2485998 RepID=UPI000F7A0500|nr:type II toxin-antitoxin system Phd/YefM family antitoxin [Lapidilactobacillus bayanensis]
MDIYTPTKARKEFFSIIKKTNENSEPVTVTRANGDDSDSVVIVSKKDWEAQQETMALLANGELQFAIAHENDDDSDDIDVDELTRQIDSENNK